MSKPLVFNEGKPIIASGGLKDMPVWVMLTKGYLPARTHSFGDVYGELLCEGYSRKAVGNIRLDEDGDSFTVRGDDVVWAHLPDSADGAVLYIPDAGNALLCFNPLGNYKREFTLKFPNGILGL